MKRRQRKQILDINGEQAESTRRRWHNKYEQIADEHPEQNGSSKNPLFNLVGHYDSDSEPDDKQSSANVLNDKVDDFLKEIQAIKPENTSDQAASMNKNQNFDKRYKQTAKSLWQECYDESTGYPYYWHMETNEVTWELPEELRFKQKSVPQSETMSRNQFMHWSPSSSKSYPHMQNNIPDGMIPKEVVARNRNRHMGNHQKPAVPERQPAVAKQSSSKDDDSDDGKIEMITSFGNDDSDSSDASEETANKSPEKVKRKEGHRTRLKRNPATPPGKDSVQIGPSLPENMVPLLHGPENLARLVARVATPPAPPEEAPGDPDIDSQESRHKVSLVPGYEDDSDNEEDTVATKPKAAKGKPLFPILESEAKVKTEVICTDRTVKKVETRQTDSGCIRIFEYHATESPGGEKEGAERREAEAAGGGEEAAKPEPEEPKPEAQDAKNKFLDEIDAPSKAFQRKKRIAFDVIPSKPKVEVPEPAEPPPTPYTTSYESEEKYGLGFSQDKGGEESRKETAPPSAASSKGSISFVKGETMTVQKEEPPKTTKMSESKKLEFKALTDTTIEKLRFLSEGSPPASAVQIMAIQLQTLLSAWESKDLREKYLCAWLTETSRELSRLEQTAAPPGWECQWDRSHKRYFYRNTANGEMQWTYPATDIVGGTEEMELCTTPPPEQEDPVEIEVNNSVPEKPQEETRAAIPEASAILAPPPPQISSPSPPPPPRISDDAKRGKKRKDESEKPFDGKKEKLDQGDAASPATTTAKSSDGQMALSDASAKLTTEPLPPGVDSPDIPYSIPNASMDSAVLYNAASQQTNPIYAATLGNAALLAHHTALMQGQLMHYPAYHPLHNQMIMATANRIAEQDTIQFMVADYSRIYESNQVIAKPPVKTTQRESICSAIDSFYNDIASIEQNNKLESDAGKKGPAETVPSSTVQAQMSEAEKSPLPADSKKKKKTKVGISKKQKEVSSMVAKWQKVQKNLSD